MYPDTITLAIAENQHLARRGMISVLADMQDMEVVMEAVNGQDLLQQVERSGIIPQVVLLDINMPSMNGYDTTRTLHDSYPEINVIAFSSYTSEMSAVRMLSLGAKAFLDKECDPLVLEQCIRTVAKGDFYHSEIISNQVFARIRKKDFNTIPHITDREQELLILSCTELSYQEIADVMGISLNTVHGYREMLFEKLRVRSRTGLALYALNMGLGPAR